MTQTENDIIKKAEAAITRVKEERIIAIAERNGFVAKLQSISNEAVGEGLKAYLSSICTDTDIEVGSEEAENAKLLIAEIFFLEMWWC